MSDTHKETKEWIERIRDEMEKKPAHDLFRLLRGQSKNHDLTVPVINNAQDLIRRVFPYRIVGGSPDSQMDADQLNRAKCSLYLYYKMLYFSISNLQENEKENDGSSEAGNSDAQKRSQFVLKNSHFHNSLLTCAVEVVAMAFQTGEFPWAIGLSGRQQFMIDLWNGIRWFERCFSSGPHPPPDGLSNQLYTLQLQIMEWRAFADGSSFYVYLLEGGGGTCLPGERHFIVDFIREVADLALTWACEISDELLDEEAQEVGSRRFLEDCGTLLEFVISEHLYLFFGRSVMAIVACCIYGLAKAFQIGLGFKTITSTITSMYPHIRDTAFTEVEINRNGKGEATTAEVRRFYNELFLPIAEGAIRMMSPNQPSTPPNKLASSVVPAAETDVDVYIPLDVSTVEMGATNDDVLKELSVPAKPRKNKRGKRPGLGVLSESDLNLRKVRF